ncbi:hypothetical protein FACS189494_00490 [Spirochaetia bacterium]|nr:hypothetical protein FACS189494_00490 [Spirochaetia bacterium]
MTTLLLILAVSFLIALFFLLFYIFYFTKKTKWKTEDFKDDESILPEGKRGEARTCPICAARFEHGESVKSKVFPPTGRYDRLLHIHGCPFCLEGQRRRKCPVCHGELSAKDYLVARIWVRPGKSHVHVQGCVRCLIAKK